MPHSVSFHLTLSADHPSEQFVAALALVFGINEAAILESVPFSKMFANYTPTIELLFNLERADGDFPITLLLKILRAELYPPDEVTLATRLCEKLGCQAIAEDHERGLSYGILVNRLPRPQHVKLRRYFLHVELIEVEEYGEVL